MKRLVLLMVVVAMGAVVQAAAPKGTTLEKFIAQKKAAAERAGKEFDQAAVEKLFKDKDKNGDGVLGADEMGGAPKKAPKAEDAGE